MDPVIIGGLIGSAQTAFQLYLRLAEQAGLTAEQQAELEATERAKFEKNRPDSIPKPPV